MKVGNHLGFDNEKWENLPIQDLGNNTGMYGMHEVSARVLGKNKQPVILTGSGPNFGVAKQDLIAKCNDHRCEPLPIST